LEGVRQQLAHATHNPATLAVESAQSRAYAFDPKTLPVEEMVEGCAGSIKSYGFCVIDDVILTEEVSAIRQEIVEAQKNIYKNSTCHQEL
jgi:hypothetical protein